MKFNSEKFRADVITKRVIECKLTLRQLAEQINVAASTISRIENSKSPDLETFIKICEWLKADPNKYFIVPGQRQDGIQFYKNLHQ